MPTQKQVTYGSFLIPNTDQRGIIDSYTLSTDFNEASKYIDPAVENLVSLGTFPMSRIDPGGTYRFGSGNVGAPGISWSADTDTGFYLNAPGDMRVSINGTYEVAFNGSGIAINDMTDGSVLFAGPSGQITQDNSFFFWNNTNKRLGLGTNTPAARLELDTGLTHLRLTYLSGSIYTDIKTGSAGQLTIIPTGQGAGVVISKTGLTTYLGIENTDTTSALSSAKLYAFTYSGAAGDAFTHYAVASTHWATGIDNSDSDKFKISNNSDPGTNDYFTLYTNGDIAFGTGSFYWDNTSHFLQLALTTATNTGQYLLKCTSPNNNNFNITSIERTNATLPRNNCHWHIGYNIGTDGVTPEVTTASEPELSIGFESYFELAGNVYAECYLQYAKSSASFPRPWFARINRSTDVIEFLMTADRTQFLDNASGNEIGRFSSAMLMLGGTSSRIGEPLGIENTSPGWYLWETDQAADARLWDFVINGGTLSARVINDAVSTTVSWLDVVRSGTAITSVTLTAGSTPLALSSNVCSLSKSVNASQPRYLLENTSNTAGSNARLDIYVGGTSAGDPYIMFYNGSAEFWSVGMANQATSRPFKVSNSTGLGTNDYLIIKTTGDFIAGKPSLATNATDGFLYVPTCAGTPTGTPTGFTGFAPIVINTTNNKLYFYSGGAWRDAGP